MFFHMYKARGRQPFVDKILMSTERPCHFAHLLLVQKNIFEVWFYTYFCLFLYMYIAQGQGLTTPWGQNFYVNIFCKFLPLNDFLTVFLHIKA